MTIQLDDRMGGLVRDGLGRLSAFVEFEAPPTAPFDALDGYLDRVEHLGDGRRELRILGAVAVDEETWERWAAYEAAFDHVFASTPVRALCAYDRSLTPRRIVRDVERTHRRLLTVEGGPDGRAPYLGPVRFFRERRPPADPLEAGRPHVELRDVTAPGPVRADAAGLAAAHGHGERTIDDLALAVSEVTTNSLLHGAPPVTVRMWGSPERLVVVVDDAGRGPIDPLVGYRRPSPQDWSGRGVWIARRLLDRLDVVWTPGGCRFRLVLDAR